MECNKKDIELEIIETACKDFFIDNAQYRFDTTGTCDLRLTTTFDFDGDNECLHLVKVIPEFYDVNGELLSSYDMSTMSFLVDDNGLEIVENSASFDMCIEHPAGIDPNDLNYIQLTFHTENEQTNESNEIGIRANIPGAPVKQPTESDFQKTIIVQKQVIDLFVFDDASEDGDIISVNANNKWVIENKMILNAGEKITLTLDTVSYFLMFYAVNEGTASPNTLAGTIKDGVTEQPINVNLKTGQVAYFKISYVPE